LHRPPHAFPTRRSSDLVLRIMNRLIVGGPILNALLLTKYMAPEFETMFVVGEKDDHEQDAGFLLKDLDIHPVYIPEMGRSLHAGDRKSTRLNSSHVKSS